MNTYIGVFLLFIGGYGCSLYQELTVDDIFVGNLSDLKKIFKTEFELSNYIKIDGYPWNDKNDIYMMKNLLLDIVLRE